MKNKLLTLLSIIIFTSIQLFAQTQKGQDLDGNSSDDELGFSVSMPDAHTIAAGAPDFRGFVKVFSWQGVGWVQKGNNIQYQGLDDLTGYSVSMADSNVIAIGSPNNSITKPGKVRIFKWNGLSWTQKGIDLNGFEVNSEFGYSISMSDSNTVAIGAYRNSQNSGNINGAGQVRIYTWSGNSWAQKGLNINGKRQLDFSGWSVSMPDSNTVAIGSPKTGFTGDSVGKTRIYRWDGVAWSQKGIDIDGENIEDLFGYSVSMPDSNTVAIGAPQNSGNGSRAGHARVYTWNGSSWIQKGIDLDGDTVGDRFGTSVTMPDANTLAVGAINNDGNGSNAGHVKVFTWNGNAWFQQGPNIQGEAAGDKSGHSVSMPNNSILAIGAPWNDAGGNNAGQVRVYEICNFIPDTLSPIVCDNYTSPSGNYTWSTSGVYLDTIINPLGCDSFYVVNLAVNNRYDSLTTAVCDSFISPSGNYVWKTSGIYNDTLPNSLSCDSIVTVNLSVTTVTSPIINLTTSLASNVGNVSYQWLSCDSNYATIPGETGQFFTPTISGNYAVAVSRNGCADTSVCENITLVGLAENSLEQITVFPNPTNGDVIINFGNNQLNADIQIRSVDGKLVHNQRSISKNQLKIDLSNYQKGIYFVTIRSKDDVRVVKLVKN